MLLLSLMKSAPLQVKFSPQSKPFTDVVGLEVGAGHPDGVPAVRLRKRDGKTELVAAGFLHLQGTLPETPDAAAVDMTRWSIPKPFHAPYAALAITSQQAFLRHSAGADEEAANKQNVYRTVTRALAHDLPPLTAGMPEFQAAWATRLLPEGRPPTACSLQVSSAAAINAFMTAPLFDSLSGTAVVLFVFHGHTSLAAFHESKLVLYREHPVGYGHLRTAISNQMRIDPLLADAVLDDTFIDPSPMIEPVLRTLFRQIEISYDYLLRRRNCQMQHFFVCGLPSGAKYWDQLFTRMLNLPLLVFHPFEDLLERPARAMSLPKDLGTVAPFLMTALGAAQAVLEDT